MKKEKQSRIFILKFFVFKTIKLWKLAEMPFTVEVLLTLEVKKLENIGTILVILKSDFIFYMKRKNKME